jgi:hypothetical protein
MLPRCQCETSSRIKFERHDLEAGPTRRLSVAKRDNYGREGSDHGARGASETPPIFANRSSAPAQPGRLPAPPNRQPRRACAHRPNPALPARKARRGTTVVPGGSDPKRSWPAPATIVDPIVRRDWTSVEPGAALAPTPRA